VALITSEGDANYDFCSRVFAPWAGVLEDPVTGSAHSVLTPFWAPILARKELKARQCSPRGGDLHLMIDDDKVIVDGDAAVVTKGHIELGGLE